MPPQIIYHGPNICIHGVYQNDPKWPPQKSNTWYWTFPRVGQIAWANQLQISHGYLFWSLLNIVYNFSMRTNSPEDEENKPASQLITAKWQIDLNLSDLRQNPNIILPLMNFVSKEFGKDFGFESWLQSDGSWSCNIHSCGTKVATSWLLPGHLFLFM